MAWWLLVCLGDLLGGGLPKVVELPMETFASQQSVRAGLQVEYLSHLEGITPPIWKSMP